MYQTEAKSRCEGCKSPRGRMAAGCGFITCALTRGIEFCWDCEEGAVCARWEKIREMGKHHDSPKCYQTLEADITLAQECGIAEFEKQQKERERLLLNMLTGYNEGRSKSFFCVAATVLPVEDLEASLSRAARETRGLDPKGKAKALRALLERAAADRDLSLKLRK